MTQPLSLKGRQEFVLPQGQLWVDFDQHAINLDGHYLELSPTEFALLVYLAQRAPQVVTATELVRNVQGYANEGSATGGEALRFHVYRLRRKIKEATQRVDLLHTIRGVGYALYAPPAFAPLPAPASPPSGAITFLFSDVEGSTLLWEQHPEAMKVALARHDGLLRQVFEAHAGYIFKTLGDGFCVAFASAAGAVQAAVAAQRSLKTEQWVGFKPLRVRIALYTGEAEENNGDYFGPTLNRVARLLAAGHGGQILVAGTTHTTLKNTAQPEFTWHNLGLRRFRGLREPEQVFQLVVADLPANFPPLNTLDPRPSNLPSELTTFVGREVEQRAICGLLRRPQVRLVTLVGMGGVGKTRLSLRVAANLLDEHEDGVFFVPLAALRRADLAVNAIAQALKIREDGALPLITQLINYLRSRQILLVLDNFEQLAEGAPIVNELLRNAPQLKVLATSRVALQIYGEQQYRVLPLAWPEQPALPTLASLAQYPAANLFLERAYTAVFDLSLQDADAVIVGEICAQLEGLPLALELAAARLNDFSLPELATQLRHRLGFLTTGPRDAPARHQNLRQMLDWSFDLLTKTEQTLLARLAVFVGGWTEVAAVAVVTDEQLPASEVVAGLTALVRKSLLQQPHTPAGPRFSMLQTVQEYAEAQLVAQAQLGWARQRHAAYYLQFVEAIEPQLNGEQLGAAVETLETENHNLRAALAWGLEQAQDETSLRLCGVMWRFWGLRSYLSEGREWLARVLAHHPTPPPASQAKALHGAGRLALYQGDYAAAQQFSRASLALYRQLKDKEGVARAYNNLGEIKFTQGHLVEARRVFQASLRLYRTLGHSLGVAKTLDDLGRIALEQGALERAEQLFTESLVLRRASGNTEGIALALMALGETLRLQGKYVPAATLTEESLGLYRTLRHTSGITTCLQNLAFLHSKQGKYASALKLYAESLDLLQEVAEDEKAVVAHCLVGLAGALLGLRQDGLTVEVLAAAEVWLDGLEAALGLAERDEFDHYRAAARAHLGKAAWLRAWMKGQAMSLEDILLAIAQVEDN